MSTQRRWTEGDNAKLRSLARTKPVEAVAAELARSPGAVQIQASKLRVSLAYKLPRVSPAYKMPKRASFYNWRSAPHVSRWRVLRNSK
jgi:hypothetical protein